MTRKGCPKTNATYYKLAHMLKWFKWFKLLAIQNTLATTVQLPTGNSLTAVSWTVQDTLQQTCKVELSSLLYTNAKGLETVDLLNNYELSLNL